MDKRRTPPSYGDIWRRFDAGERRLSKPLSERMLELGNLEVGMRVLDLATGRGEPAVLAARRVHPGGMVLGVDVDRSVLQIARERAIHEGLDNLVLAVSDAEWLDAVPTRAFDVALCRWGLMYFQRPLGALRAVRRSLVAGGSLVAAVWTDPDHASFQTLPRASLAPFMPIPRMVPGAPGTFFYAGLDRLTDDLKRAGFEIHSSEVHDVDVMEARSDGELIDWCRSIGMPRLLQSLPTDWQTAWERELVRAAAPHRGKDGSVRLGGRSLVVVAA